MCSKCLSTTCMFQFTPSFPLKCCVSLLLSSLPLFFFFPLICGTHCEEAHPCSSEICAHIVRNVCPSWHYNALYQLTRGVGGERGGREEDVKMLGSWEEGKKKRALCGCLSDRIWSNSMALAFGKIASFNGHSLQEASPDMRPHMSERLRERERERAFQEERRQPEVVLEVPYFVNCPR